MKLKRIITSVSAQFDDLVSKIENHEAIAESAIKQARQQTAKIHSQIKVTERRLTLLQKQQQETEQKAQLWQQRAIASEKESGDHDKALQCVQAMQHSKHQAEKILQQIQSLTQLKTELQGHLQASEQQLDDLNYRKQSLAARSAKNNVQKLTDTEQDNDIEGVFDRWEQHVAANEYISATDPVSDNTFEQQFMEQESTLALEDSLQQLLKARSEKGAQ